MEQPDLSTKPTHRLIMLTGRLPDLDDSGKLDMMCKRILDIAFPHQFSARGMDHKMKFRLKTTVNNETSSVFITKEDAVVIAGDEISRVIELVEKKGGDAECTVTKTMKIEVMKF